MSEGAMHHYIAREHLVQEKAKSKNCKSQNSNILKGVFAKNERGYRLNAIKKRF